MSGPLAAILLTLIVHIVAFILLFALCGRGMIAVFRAEPYGGDDWREPPSGDPETPPAPTGGGLPMPDAEQAPVRLREPGRIGERYPRPERRREHPQPVRVPQRS